VPLRALLLDFDGLICDTERAARRSWEELYGERGVSFPPGLWATMVGRPEGEATAIADLSGRLGEPLDAAVIARRRRRKDALCRQEPLRPGVAELLTAAAGLGLAVAVVSSSSLPWVQSHLVRLAVRDRVDVLVTGDDAARPKPAPDLYRVALARTGVTACEALAFEDSPIGIRAARAAGVRCIAIPGSAGDRDELRAADAVLDSLVAFTLDAAPGPPATVTR
jgi:HAD superfamily hydrolase (TIGR01509 family)